VVIRSGGRGPSGAAAGGPGRRRLVARGGATKLTSDLPHWAGMEHPDAVLFDLDGTIVDSRIPYTRSLNHALAAVGLPEREPSSLYQYLGPPLHETLTDHLGVPAELVDRCIEIYRERYTAVGFEESEAYEGMPELLRELHGRVPLAVATSKVITLVDPLLEMLGLADLFDVISGPAPEAINESKATTIASALSGLGGSAGSGGDRNGAIRSAVMIGDRFYDVEGAAAHGIPTIGVLWGSGSEQELRDAGAVAVVTHPDEIPALLGL
jgi:phosphoglycolate phosphatase